MRRAIPFAALALSLASAGVARADDAKSAQPPPEPEVEFVNRGYGGMVTELTRDREWTVMMAEDTIRITRPDLFNYPGQELPQIWDLNGETGDTEWKIEKIG
jgi:hypothetical protein